MKSNKKLAFPIIAALTLLVNGCIIEEENDYTYILVNESSINITLERVGGYDDNFTSNSVQINAESQFSFHYYDISLPFLTTDSLYFKNNGVILRKFGRQTEGKNPLRIEYYDGGKVGYKRHITSYEYTFKILDTDFTK